MGKVSFRLIAATTLAIMTTGCSSRRPVAALPPSPSQASQAGNNHPSVQPQNHPEPKKDAAKIIPVPTVPAAPDAVDGTIAEAEIEYKAGQDKLAAGDVNSAKASFDRALTLLSGGSADVHLEPRLQREFDRIQAALVTLNAQTAAADQPPAQKSEPAPIDEANEVALPVDPTVKAKAAAEIKATHSDLPLMLTDPVASYIAYFSTRGRGTLEHALTRSGRYQEMIRRVLREQGLPQDLIYLAQAESGFHPLALSRAGARGIWQFMATRANGYGLERDIWVDERQDPEKATRAAAHHLKDLYNQFGDWYLAMAAYNSGPGTVQSAVKRTGYADFWELYKRNALPKETRNYVPIILAETIMAKNRAQYGLENIVPDEPVPSDVVTVQYSVDLRLVAECVDAPLSTLEDLNPSLLRMVTPKARKFELHLPLGTKDRYLTAIAAIPEDMRVWWRYHRVMPGDNLASLARSYHTTPIAISHANGLGKDQELEPDAELIIPVSPGRHPDGETQTYSRRATVYRVRKGDTVQSVADNFGVPTLVVRRWNHLTGNSLRGRRILYVHLPISPGSEPIVAKSSSHMSLQAHNRTSQLKYTVKRGETFYSIATSFNTTVAAIKHSNRNIATLRPGTVLLIRRND